MLQPYKLCVAVRFPRHPENKGGIASALGSLQKKSDYGFQVERVVGEYLQQRKVVLLELISGIFRGVNQHRGKN